ncbi:MAG: hypothetical protein Q9215_003906 [Flavoplaca cf. flavocitrina]
MPLVGGHRYLPSTAVFLCEVLKLTICTTLALYDMSRTMSPSAPATSLFGGLVTAVITGDSWKVAIPASLYVLQNTLQYFAISNLDTATFQVTYQFKIIPTALFSVILLRRRITPRQWLALLLLMIGVVIVQNPTADSSSLPPLKGPHIGFHSPWSLAGFRSIGSPAMAHLSKRSATYEGIQEDDTLEYPKADASMGIAAALMGCVVSSLASVYLERILKDAINPVSLWVRNVQLSFYLMFPALFIGVFYMDGEKIARDGFFAGYNWAVWSTLILQALGGMVVSLCVKHADNISKSFAMSISILISLCASVIFFEFKVTTNFVMGTVIVSCATVLYSRGANYQHQDASQDLNSSLQMPAAFSRYSSSLPSTSRHQQQPPASQNSFGQSSLHRTPPIFDGYDAPLDAFDQALLDGPKEPRQRLNSVNDYRQIGAAPDAPFFPQDLEEQQSKQLGYPLAATAQNRLRHSFQTPPSQLVASLSSPTNLAPSSPLAGVIQRREAQASQPSTQSHNEPDSTSTFPSFRAQPIRNSSSTINLRHAPPIVQGIQLVSPSQLPDRFRSIFPFPLFNAVQSKCFGTAYGTSDNLVLSAPTGSGKTVILELSICQLMAGFQTGQFKVVYMAPTKSLCAERQKDWQGKFASLDLQCAELTGDTDNGQLRMVQNASIIITTPEKWDSMTRKWKDHAKLMQLVKLFLIDEVHILNENRGACLEAVVSRMKSVGSNVRFLALSATVPNSDDIATWLGLNPTTQHVPACRERFGEEFRPVKLQKHVYGLSFGGNDWGFDKVCDPKLPEIIAKHSQKKPIMVFCITRKATVSTAKLLANWWTIKSARERQWAGPTFKLVAQDPDLKETLSAAVAFHHAGLDPSDRHVVEKGFLEGQVNVICCTSTLAVGVNLPCHMVIIKNTVCFQEEGLKEYADLEIMQMLGRAGRPQFEDSAVAVIITKQEKLEKYEKMVSGQQLLESSLHLNLIEHLNAEIGLGTIHSLYTAKRWLSGTFLYVRLKQNPAHYRLDGEATQSDLEDRIERVCQRDIDLLLDTQLVTDEGDRIKCTEFGDAMARYYVKFETMKGLLNLEPRSKMSDILSILVGAQEFHDVRYRVTEKRLLKELNGACGIKYPIKIDIALPEHKRSLIIQSELGGVDFPADEQFNKFKRQYQQDKNLIFNHIHRLVRCVIDCQIHLQDAITVRHALELARGFAARVWDNSPHQMKQVPNIGPAAVRRLANGGINSLETLEEAEPHKIEMLLSKHPPFGSRILTVLKDFPKLRVSVKLAGKDVKQGQPVKIKFKAEVGFMNIKPPDYFNRKAVHVCFLAERSDGHLIDFRRFSGTKLGGGHDILLSTDLMSHTQYVSCYIMCDEIAGTMRYAELRPGLPASAFSSLLPITDRTQNRNQLQRKVFGTTSRGSKKDSGVASPATVQGDEEFYDNDVADADMFEAGVDKPPKAPKKAAAANPAPKEPKVKPSSGGQTKQDIVQSKLHVGTSTPPNKRKVTDRVDLAHEKDANEYAKVAPRAYRSLHQLHEKVNKDSRTPTMSNIKPSFSYKKGEQPTFSFLGATASSSKRTEEPSSDYDTGFLDDFPSPSALLRTSHEVDLPKVDYEDTGAVDDTFALEPEKLGETGSYAEVAEEKGEKNDEAAVFANTEYEEAMENLGSGGCAEASPYFQDAQAKRVEDCTSYDKLFMSTDSPRKPSSPNVKRVHSGSPSNKGKRRKVDSTLDSAALRPSSSNGKQGSPLAPRIKAGYPAWVYEFDPAFIAEWEPYAEFV